MFAFKQRPRLFPTMNYTQNKTKRSKHIFYCLNFYNQHNIILHPSPKKRRESYIYCFQIRSLSKKTRKFRIDCNQNFIDSVVTLICPHDSMVVIVHFNNLHEYNLLFKAFLFAKIRIIKNKINGLKGKIRTDMCKY